MNASCALSIRGSRTRRAAATTAGSFVSDHSTSDGWASITHHHVLSKSRFAPIAGSTHHSLVGGGGESFGSYSAGAQQANTCLRSADMSAIASVINRRWGATNTNVLSAYSTPFDPKMNISTTHSGVEWGGTRHGRHLSVTQASRLLSPEVWLGGDSNHFAVLEVRASSPAATIRGRRSNPPDGGLEATAVGEVAALIKRVAEGAGGPSGVSADSVVHWAVEVTCHTQSRQPFAPYEF